MKRFQVTAIGNALVDILATADDDFLAGLGVQKSTMLTVGMAQAVVLYDHLGPTREVSGGSAANTVAIFAGLGGRAAFVGKVKNDQMGRIFAHDMRSLGIDFATVPIGADLATETGRCISIITPDGERSMVTCLGASLFLDESDILDATMRDTEWLFVEGYLLDGINSRDAVLKARQMCRASGGRVALTLSDPGCVARNRNFILDLMIDGDIDLIFANRKEIQALFPQSGFEAAIWRAAEFVPMVVCTDGPRGAFIATQNTLTDVPAAPATVVDTTGAGDSFAGAFLWALVNGRDPQTCARIGALAAAEVISAIGARPEHDIRTILARHGLLDGAGALVA